MQENPNKITYFAKTDSRGKETPFGIKRRDRARHMYVIGKTGMGKSTLLENMAIQDIRNGEAMAFIDPHGSTADRLLEYIPEHRIKDVVYFAPFDMDYPIAFNVMEDVGYDKRHLVVSGLLAAFRKIWVDAWSARMEYILSNTLLALLEYEGSTLLDVNRMLINKGFRKKVVDNVSDPIVKSFWVEEFANYTDRYTQDATPAIQNKIGQFTSNPLIRNIVGQPKSSFDIREIMDQRKILIMNLSKGRVGEVNATLLGSMLVTKIYLAAMSRADVTADTLTKLPSFYFYVDEFQNFANQSFADILSEARKYKLNLIIAHQYVEQMEEEVRDAVFGNVGTTVAFRVGPFDAEVLETIFQPQFTATDLVNLGFAQIYLTLMIDGVGSPPFSATTIAPFDPPPGSFVDKVLDSSRKQFAEPRPQVEEAISAWHQIDLAAAPAAAKPRRTPTPPLRAEPRREVRAEAPRPTPPIPAEPRPQPTPPPAAQIGEKIEATPPPRGFGVAEGTAAEVRHTQAQAAGAQAAKQHNMAASRAGNDRPEHSVPKPRRAPEPPPLEGAQSLRDALRQVTQRQTPEPSHAAPKESLAARPQMAASAHAPDLKATLGRIISSGEKREPPVSQKPKESNQQRESPAQLPEEVLREMLAVEHGDEDA